MIRRNNAPPSLSRKTFTTSRQMEFCSVKELTAVTGHGPGMWATYAANELIDNSLDACEESGVAPVITVKVDAGGISISDNGPGIPPDTIAKIGDFGTRSSSREARVSPARGAQGNAFQTLLAISGVVGEERRGRVDVSARGVDHTITFAVDEIQQKPVIEHDQTATQKERNGTFVKLHWPDVTTTPLAECKSRFLQMVLDCTALNPHLTLTIDWFGDIHHHVDATCPEQKKW